MDMATVAATPQPPEAVTAALPAQNGSDIPLHASHGGHGGPTPPAHGPLGRWMRLPLYLRIVIGLVVGLVIGACLRPFWHGDDSAKTLLGAARVFTEISRLILRMLGAIAPPLILIAVLKSLMTTNIKGGVATKLIYLLLLNTVVAICIGLFVANILQPGTHAHLVMEGQAKIEHNDPLGDFLNSVPDSLVGPLVTNNSIGVILIALAFGMAARKLPAAARDSTLRGVSIAFDLILIVLYWILELVPLAVACKVASIITTSGVAPFKALGWFIFAVLSALFLQSIYYLIRVRLRSWVRPSDLVRDTRDALVMAFSTGSSTATMPLTYECLHDRVGLRAEAASLGALVGGNFNHDGTALYEAMSALFVAQTMGLHLSLYHQVMVVLTSIVAAVGAAGIPEAGLVTMALVFSAVGLPVANVALLLPVDWFLDRCRTAINVMGDTNVSCLLDGMTPEKRGEVEPATGSEALVSAAT